MLRCLNSLLYNASALLLATCLLIPLSAEEPVANRLEKPSAASSTLFDELPPAATGLNFTNPIDLSHPWKYLYASSMSSGGVAIGDFDGDGKPDVFLTSGPGKNKLFRLSGSMKFTDVTTKAGVDGGDAWAVGCAMADVNGDGKMDLYVCNYLTANQLYLNNGDGTFTDKAKEFHLDLVDACHTPTFCDYDGDGKLDLYVLTNRWYVAGGLGFPEEQTIEPGPGGKPTIMAKWEKYYDAVQTGDKEFKTRVVGRPDYLLHNNGDGTFTDVTKKAGINHRGHGLSATWFDWDGDHRPDLWVGNDFDDADHLYKNMGDGTFKDVTVQTVTSTTWFSMGADFGDVDGDGWLDFFIADMAGSNHFKQKTAMGNMGGMNWLMENSYPAQLMRNCLFINAQNGRFQEAGFLSGLARTNWTWAVRLADFDNDGRNDVYVQSGMSRNFNEKDDKSVLKVDPTKSQWDRFETQPPMKEPCLSFRNEGGLKFTDTSKDWGLNYNGMSYGCALSDLDGDGDLDIVSVRLDEPVAILRNNSQKGNRVVLQFRGTGGNTYGLGTQVRLTTAAGTQVRELTPTRGYLGQDEPAIVFGLGEEKTVSLVEIFWRDGKTQRLENLQVNHKYVINEAKDAVPIPTPAPAAPTLFARSAGFEKTMHRQEKYDDYVREPLLPNSMSQWGPGQAWGDVDGDGFVDLYLGQGRGVPRKIYLNKGGQLTPTALALPEGAAGDDMGVLLFDADGDGDADLFVVSGGVSCNAGDASLQDRLFLNDGKGNFTLAPAGTIPQETDSGGPVAAADFDHDGDLDLFIGGRCVPGSYPLAGKSHLLRNDAGKFTDVTSEIASALQSPGMVTGAVWTDVDNDGWVDLALGLEWGPITIFHNDHGKLSLREDSALAALSGWWNGLTAADLDGDGAMDLVATNFGLNTKYHASADHPVLIYYGDMDDSGNRHIVEAEFEGDTLFPVRGKSCSGQAMPFIKEKFSTFSGFATASLGAIYTPEKLEKAQKFSATNLTSGVFWNDGKGRFTFDALPWQVQTAPAFGMAVTDADGDGLPDLVVAQNFSYAQVETGRMNGGLSVLLQNKGKRQWQPLPPVQSGISVPWDSRSLAVVDLDADGRNDLSFGLNNGPVVSLRRPPASAEANKSLAIMIKCPKGNPQGIGTRVTVKAAGLPAQTAEVQAGSGYLTQGSATLFFGLGKNAGASAITVRWPDGKISEYPTPSAKAVILLQQP
jgi:hypothetical protein